MRLRFSTVGLAVVTATLVAGTAAAKMTTEERLRQLENTVRTQQQRIEQLEGELQRRETGGPAAPAAAPAAQPGAAAEKPTAAAQAPSEKPAATQVAGITLPTWVEKITPFGDLRTRFEGFYNRPGKEGDSVHARNRTRIRARIGLRYTPSDELQAVFRLASGNPDDPISTNETLTGEFTRKHINLDWGYLTFTPGKTFGIRPGLVSITGGKFANPLLRPSELVFDEDLSVEGFGETVQLLGKPVGPLEQLRLSAQQWSFAEVDGAEDGWMIGGQVNPVFKLGSVAVEGGIGQYGWLRADRIAQALNSNKTLVNTNRVVTETGSNGSTSIVDYASDFNQTNLVLTATLPDVAWGMPLRTWVDYVHNWEGEGGDDDGFQIGAKFGQPKVRGDWAVSALYEYLEREAVISAFTWSDFGNGGTNGQGPVIALDYQLLDPLTLTARSYFVNFIDRPTGMDNPTLVRVQLDAQVKF